MFLEDKDKKTWTLLQLPLAYYKILIVILMQLTFEYGIHRLDIETVVIFSQTNMCQIHLRFISLLKGEYENKNVVLNNTLKIK